MDKNLRNYFDLYIRDIQIIIYKKEDITFRYDCINRINAGFIVITNGKGHFKTESYEKDLKQGDVLIIDKIDKYSIYSLDDNFSYVTMAFSLGEGQRFRAFNIPYRVNLNYEEIINPLLSELLEVWKIKPLNYKIKARGILNDLLLEVTNKTMKKFLLNEKFTEIYSTIEYINANYNKNINLDDVALMAGYSSSHYRKKFKEYLGISPQKYIENIRIDSAKEMIKSEMFTFSEIAEKLGYCDIYHFSKDFKKNTGITPKQYQIDGEKYEN